MATTPAIPNAQQQAAFYTQYEVVRRDEVVGVLLAFFLGTFGAHHFYLRRTGLGVLYCCLAITGISAILGFIECFFMPGRVRAFNTWQATMIAANLGIAPPSAFIPVPAAAYTPAGGIPARRIAAPIAPATCPSCGQPLPSVAVRFCAQCGTAISA